MPAERLMPLLQDVLVAERRTLETFTTACMIIVSPDRRSAQVWLAGHHVPIALDPAPALLPSTGRGPALGLLPHATWEPLHLELGEAWRLLIFTDGLFEGRVGRGSQRLGKEGLVDLLAASPVLHDTATLLDDVLAKAVALNGDQLSDDVAIVALEYPREAGTQVEPPR
jgi:serine phosphatase RsbU (regulator of sigma subunit)